MSSTTTNRIHNGNFPGMPDAEDEDDDVNNTSTASTFKFPFFDNNEELDLSWSHTVEHFLSPPPPPSRRKSSFYENEAVNHANGVSSPSGFGTMTISPIAKNRESESSDGVMGGTGEREMESTSEEEPPATGDPTEPSAPPPSTPPHDPDDAVSELVDDLQSARKHVGESSSNFIDKIRNAAHKRKVAVTRSRDSLVAKEQEQLRSIAESMALKSSRTINPTHNGRDAKENEVPQERAESSLFKNRLKSRKSVGFSGCGVPKVEKRPTTTPFSPLLGFRRKQKVSVKALEAPRLSILKTAMKKSTASKSRKPVCPSKSNYHDAFIQPASAPTVETSTKLSTAFKARPMPSSTGSRGRAGQLGVPKVPKRPVTIPVSPGLGRRRQNQLGSTNNRTKVASNVPSQDSTLMRRSTGSLRSLGTKSSTTSNGENSGLLGLNLLGATPESVGGRIVTTDSNHTPRHSSIQPFEPQSTRRANERAQFDVIRNENRQARLREEREQLHTQIRMIQKELLVLREEI